MRAGLALLLVLRAGLVGAAECPGGVALPAERPVVTGTYPYGRARCGAAAMAPAPVAAEAPRPLRIAAYAAGAVGVILVASGIYFGLRVRSLDDQANQQAATGVPDRKVIDDANNAVEWQWVGLGLGAAFLAGGVVAYWLSRDDHPEHAVSLAPALSRHGAGASLRLRF